MGLLDTELGKRRLLAVEVPAIEAYNDGRAGEYRIAVTRLGIDVLTAMTIDGFIAAKANRSCWNITIKQKTDENFYEGVGVPASMRQDAMIS